VASTLIRAGSTFEGIIEGILFSYKIYMLLRVLPEYSRTFEGTKVLPEVLPYVVRKYNASDTFDGIYQGIITYY